MKDADTAAEALREGLRDKAKHILEALAEQADVEPHEHVIIIEDDDGDREEDPGMNTYCADCIDKAVEDYKKDNAEEVAGKDVDYTTFQGCEHEGFEHCDACGKIIDTCLLLDDQELEYWEQENPLDPLANADRAWELTEILNNQDDELEQRVDTIARRIIRETGYLPSRKVKTAEVRWLDFLSPDLTHNGWYGSLKIGLERTIYALQWLGKTLAHDASSYWYPAALRGTHWRQDLSDHFHTFLVQEYGRSFTDGNCSRFKWETLIERRKQHLVFDRPQKIRIPSVHRCPHEIHEYAFDNLMTRYQGKKLTRNPQVDLDDRRGWGCRDRGGWQWEFGEASLHVYSTLLSFHIEYKAPDAPGSSWELQLPQNDGESLFDFLVRVDETLARYIDPAVVTYQFLYADSRTYENEYEQIFFHGESWYDCAAKFQEWISTNPEEYNIIDNRAERWCRGIGGLGYEYLSDWIGWQYPDKLTVENVTVLGETEGVA